MVASTVYLVYLSMNDAPQPFLLISQYLDDYFAALQKEDPYAMAHYAREIPKSMLDPNRLRDDSYYAAWKPIRSTFSDKELKALEKLYGYPLPPSYRHFLRQWHFLQLILDGASLRFFPSVPKQLAKGFGKILQTYYWQLPKRGILPFANYSDWGVAAFNAHSLVHENEYPVVILDHDDGYTKPMTYTENFMGIFEKMKAGLCFLGKPGWQPDPNVHR